MKTKITSLESNLHTINASNSKPMKPFLFTLIILIAFLEGCSPSLGTVDTKINEAIRVNQLGYYPEADKIAVVTEEPESNEFFLLDTKNKQQVFEGKLSAPVQSVFSDKTTWIADYSDFEKAGEFCVYIPSLGCSPSFQIQANIFEPLGKASLKSYYFQRATMDLEEKYAGIWARPAGHPDDQVQIHASAASPSKPEGTVLSAPMGWYDAGDYNKYIVNSGITMGTLMSLYEDFPEESRQLDLSIPESDNAIPDLIDELLWNLRWMANMQDSEDGGVYHKLTTARFEGMVLPHKATNQRYVVAKSTAAALDFAAVMAQASRILKAYHPNLAAEYLKAAESAWHWAKKNPEVLYRQNDMNKIHQPEIHTGAYGDNSVEDEWVWAASELFISTQNPIYLQEVSVPDSFELPTWNKVSWLGYYSLLRFSEDLEQLPSDLLAAIRSKLMDQANAYVDFANSGAYRSAMGHTAKDFVWGSNAVASNQGIVLLQAYRLSGEQRYLDGALSNLDYMLGRNAIGYSYVTGFGYKTPKRPHHRLAEAEPEKEPLPGFIVGGPNPGQQDGCNYSSKIPDESYTDEACSYASNEIAINWNAPFAYLVNAVEFLSREMSGGD
ncbi:glycoside hydrolase family 9 protein [Lunatibacter salilacus]|uniref:glycoside hydrolase family 9 protein n=1 Tax=Lunatibacter salilacus TaxID=2483804 RepID=UPI001F30E5AB|nr:glycoside hydrolase family 9 protein [Lunatibacter salilacus]